MKFLFSKTLFLLFLSLFQCISYFGQTANNSSIGMRFQYGYILAHRPSVLYLAQQHVPSFEVFYQQRPKIETLNNTYNHPKVGYSFLFQDFKNKKYLGNAIAVDRFIELPLSKKNNFHVHLGTGIGYLTEKFNRIETNKNIVIGSNLNIHLALGLLYAKEIGNLSFTGGFIFNHYSNGSFKTPNLGINVPSLQIGAAYVLSKMEVHRPIEKQLFVKKNYVTINTGFGIKETYDSYNEKFNIYCLSSSLNREISDKSIILGGLDIIYNSSLVARAEFDSLPVPEKKVALSQLGVNIGYGLKFNKLHLLFQTGFYAISKYKGDGSIYNRLSARYYVADQFFLNFALKSHFAKADYGEIGVGLKIKSSKK